MVAVSALVLGLDAELGRLGYKDSTLVWYRGYWRLNYRRYADDWLLGFTGSKREAEGIKANISQFLRLTRINPLTCCA